MKRPLLPQLKIILVACLFTGILFFSAFQSRNILAGPNITILEPDSKSDVDHSLIEVIGIVEQANKVLLNGRKIYLDEKGRFEEKILVAEGYTILKVEATDQFGRSQEKQIEVIFKPSEKTARANEETAGSDSP